MLEEKGLIPTPEAREHLDAYLKFLYDYRDKYFGNARTVRNVVNEAVKAQNLRLAALDEKTRAKTEENLLMLDDLQNFKLDKSGFLFNKKTIGFKKKEQGSN